MAGVPFLRAQRSNPDYRRGDILDCFAGARNDDVVRDAHYKFRCHAPRWRGIQYTAAVVRHMTAGVYWIIRLRG
ncbi:hypothetical protein BJS_01909 [Bradyrhizobium japonicum SEMIA 5079]|nr:hypothetical protein BJS_01909 [Bradyrhizobium japonicum SEMIA 5079]